MADRARISAITHGDLAFHNPLDPAQLDEVLLLLPLTAAGRALDLGCGAGELLVRLAETTGCGGLGVDDAEVQIAEARRRAAARVPDGRLAFEVADARRAGDAGPFDLVACVGSMHAVDGDWDRLAALAAPGGHVLVGDGFWRRPPEAPYLEVLGATADELPDLPGLAAQGAAAGLELSYLAVTTDEAWDRYEWTLIHNGLSWAAAHRDDPLAADVAGWARTARGRVLTPGGRDTLGFVLLLFAKPV